MSVSEDLARNRRVFELLTGVLREPEIPADSPAFADGGLRPPNAPLWARRESASPTFSSDATPIPRLSLRYGDGHYTGTLQGFEAPDSIEFPALRGSGAVPAPDPLEALYLRLETDARMTSQLSGEEEF